MPRCCQCKGGGFCKRCSCVRDDNVCKDCYPSLLGHCLNLPSDDPDFSELDVNPVVQSDVSSDTSNNSSVPNEAFDPVNNRSHQAIVQFQEYEAVPTDPLFTWGDIDIELFLLRELIMHILRLFRGEEICLRFHMERLVSLLWLNLPVCLICMQISRCLKDVLDVL